MSEIVYKIVSRIPGGWSSPENISTVSQRRDRSAESVEPPASSYFNRELSDLLCVERVLDEARNDRHPLLERLRFLAIAAQILEQFYTVRIAKLRRDVRQRKASTSPDWLTPATELALVSGNANDLMMAQESTWASLPTELASCEIAFPSVDELDDHDKQQLHHYFLTHVHQLIKTFITKQQH
ncbi:MAG: hypothetical protein HUJ31_12920, partial [Pseudomonadales bacterium]|nr:hypothetical protein [Pseudomonadales bacterium]